MSVFFTTAARRHDPVPVSEFAAPNPGQINNERLYTELVAQRPALLDEKLKLHQRIIDEFNLSLLEKLPREELLRIVLGYVTDYVRAEQLSLNQKKFQTSINQNSE